ncbi:MAG: hypothetical protein M3083_07660 [Actinomycetota bacterium]|nr:hypothetical protein [Actinomycetota bacterium]
MTGFERVPLTIGTTNTGGADLTGVDAQVLYLFTSGPPRVWPVKFHPVPGA